MVSSASIRHTDDSHQGFWTKRKAHMKESLPAEWAVFKKAWPMMLIGAFFQLVHSWLHNMAYYFAGEYKVYGPYKGPTNNIHDFGFEMFGTGMVDLGWSMQPSDYTLYITLIVAVAYVLRPFFFAFPHRSVSMLWRVLTMTIFTVSGRVLSFIFTILPSSASHCSQEQFSPPKDWMAVFTSFSTSGGCSDLIYSGHMSYILLAACALFRYGQNPYIKVFSVVMVITQSCVIIASRAHYTVDVIVALYTVPCMWFTFAYFVPEDIGAKPATATKVVDPPAEEASAGGSLADLESGGVRVSVAEAGDQPSAESVNIER